LGEVVGDAAAIVEPESIESMAHQLEAVATDPARREELRLAGLARAREFRWNIAAEKTMKVYENAARTVGQLQTTKPALVETV
jgi:glycosyltransferase involved in cell wall biosynthesis